MTYRGKKLNDIDKAQQLELERQKAIDDKHDAQFSAMFMVCAILVIWCSVLTFAVLQK